MCRNAGKKFSEIGLPNLASLKDFSWQCVVYLSSVFDLGNRYLVALCRFPYIEPGKCGRNFVDEMGDDFKPHYAGDFASIKTLKSVNGPVAQQKYLGK